MNKDTIEILSGVLWGIILFLSISIGIEFLAVTISWYLLKGLLLLGLLTYINLHILPNIKITN